MNIISLFDGMSCGKIALDRAGIPVSNYYASEIDKFAIQISQKNHSNISHLGDVRGVNGEHLGHIDILLGGSPCQGFSFAGKKLNFDDPRSVLFFEYVRILKETRPKYFLLENVKMKKESQDVISEFLGVEPVEINSSFFSAQNRIRLYWTNIKFDQNFKENKTTLKDIILSHDGHKTFPYINDGKKHFDTLCHRAGIADLKTHDARRRVYYDSGKSPTLTTSTGGYHAQKIEVNENEWRYLTPIEYERLQTVDDNYTQGVSNTQRYKMLGNGWTIEVIANILKGIKV